MVSLNPFRLRTELPEPLRVTVPVSGITLLFPERSSPALTTVPPPQLLPVELMASTPSPDFVNEAVAVPVTVAVRSRSTAAGLLEIAKVRLAPKAMLPEMTDPVLFVVELTVTVPPSVRVPAPVLT